jgi:hypothetical protein
MLPVEPIAPSWPFDIRGEPFNRKAKLKKGLFLKIPIS